jgi:hypothetical protein
MKIGFVFYGIAEGRDLRTGYEYDFRHCWPNIKRMLVNPFVEKGHEAINFVSTYNVTGETEKDLIDVYNPKNIFYSEKNESDSFTTKSALFHCIENEDLDAVVATRMSIHFSKIIANENVDLNKINLLFPEGDGWWERFGFSCDGLHIWNHRYTKIVRDSMRENYGWPRGKQYPDTHGLLNFLLKRVSENEINLVSTTPEISNCNSFYTLCRPAEFGHVHFHQEVAERFKDHEFFRGKNNEK